jgi:hypothetical protein
MKYFTLFGSGLVLAGVLSAAAVGAAAFDFQWVPPSTSPLGALAPSSSGAGGATLEDPQGDIFGLGICPPPPDIKSLHCRVVRRGTRLNCTVNFFAPANDDIRANGPVRFIDFDTDQNPATGGLLNTGGLSNTDIFGPPGTNTGLGMDYNVFFFRITGQNPLQLPRKLQNLLEWQVLEKNHPEVLS